MSICFAEVFYDARLRAASSAACLTEIQRLHLQPCGFTQTIAILLSWLLDGATKCCANDAMPAFA
jgi:hypothetical protein